MNTRRLALVRAEEGPWVPTRHIRKPHVKVVGLIGAVVRIIQLIENEEVETIISENGCFELQPAHWTRVFCSPKCNTVICQIVSSRVA